MKRLAVVMSLFLASASAQGLELDLSGETGGPFRIEAEKSIEWRRDEKVYVAEGGVRFQRGDIVVRAETVSAYYRGEAADGTGIYRIEAVGGVTIQSPDGTAKGGEAVYTVDRSLFVLRGGGPELKADGYVLTTRDSLEFNREEGYAAARGAARIVRGDDSVSAETLLVRFDSEGGGALKARRVEGAGGIEVRSGADSVSGARGFYDIEAQKAEICGDARIQQGPNRMTGECAQVDFVSGNSRLVAGSGGRVQGVFDPKAGKRAPER